MFNTITALLTDSCNFKCKYCFENRKNVNMSLDTAKKCLNMVRDGGQFCFFGGEPLLMFESIIKPLFEEYKKGNKKVRFSITTNASLLTKEVYEYLVANNVSILISFDGAKTTQDINRPMMNGKSSFDATIDNIKYVLSRNPNQCIRLTVETDTCQYLAENIDFLYNIGVKSVHIEPNCFGKWSEYVDVIKSHKPQHPEIISNKRDVKEQDIFDSCGFKLSRIVISPEGKYYGCHRLMTDEWCLGSIDEGITKSRYDEVTSKYAGAKLNVGCDKCKNNCKGNCIGTNSEATGDPTKNSKDICLFKEVITEWQRMKNI